MQFTGLTLNNLTLKNFATFEDQTIIFDQGFNAIVGETGSGKSLILDALQLILGHRADKRIIRKDFEFAIVEGTFNCNDDQIKKYFDENDFPFDGEEVYIKRILYRNGKSKAYLNHQQCPLTTLTKFSKRFIDLVGQFENQKLLSSDYQLKLLDQFSINETLKSEYQKIFTFLSEQQLELKNLESRKVEVAKKLDYLNFQISEFEKLDPSVDREVELNKKKRVLQNLEENKVSVNKLNSLFDGGHQSGGLINLLNQIESELTEKLLDQDTLEQFFNAKEVLIDMNYKINSSINLEFDEKEFEHVLEELDLYQRLKRKYQVSTEDLIDIYNSYTEERKELENLTDSVELIKDKVMELSKSALMIAEKLHERRISYAKDLSKSLTLAVQKLRMQGATISIKVDKVEELNSQGISKVSFLAETNPGEGHYKIKEIASGGELSRILLSLRTILSSKDSISIFLFDEIDTGIGGETAISVGEALNKVSTNSQVIAITHLPQIAKFSNKLIKVSKHLSSDLGRTFSQIEELTQGQIEKEIKEMTSL